LTCGNKEILRKIIDERERYTEGRQSNNTCQDGVENVLITYLVLQITAYPCHNKQKKKNKDKATNHHIAQVVAVMVILVWHTTLPYVKVLEKDMLRCFLPLDFIF